jgi:hypothetical protein
MYYEEKIIDGVLHYRTLPDADFKSFTLTELTSELKKAQAEIARLEMDIKRQRVLINTEGQRQRERIEKLLGDMQTRFKMRGAFNRALGISEALRIVREEEGGE